MSQPFRISFYAAVLEAIPELRTDCECLQHNVWAPCMLNQIDVLQSLPLLQDGANLALSTLTELVTLPVSASPNVQALHAIRNFMAGMLATTASTIVRNVASSRKRATKST